MAELQELMCPNCGAPAKVSTTRCERCKVLIAATEDEVGPAPPLAVTSGRAERLGKALDSEGVRDICEETELAWQKRGTDSTLSDDETFARDVLVALLGCMLLAARGQDRGVVAESLSVVSKQVLSVGAAADVVKEGQAYVDRDGMAARLAAGAELVEEAELGADGYELVAGLVLVRGVITAEQGKLLDAIADAFGMSVSEAREVRARIAELMA
jgi:hypothetical protein